MPLSVRAYDRAAAVAYATRWAFDRNPAYLDFSTLGGDCTNFASQCLFAGSGTMNFTPVYGWYYTTASRRTASWTGVSYLYQFLIRNQGAGPFAVETELAGLMVGDIVQLVLDQDRFQHSPVVVAIDPGTVSADRIYLAAHSDDAYNRPLSSYPYRQIRCLHIQGVRR